MALIGSSLNDFLFFDYITEGNVWTATPYQNCSYRCVYCGVDSQGNSSPHADKHNILDQLDKEFTRISQLPHGPKPASTIVIGACTDPYPPSEQHNCITRELLSFFIKRNIRISILTKSTLILRDMDLLKNYDKVDVCLSICAHDHKLVEHLEPYAPPIEERFRAIAELHQSGIKVRVNAAPWIPGISNAEEIVKRTPDGVLVAFGPLELDNSHYDVLIGVNKTSAAKALGKQFTQNEINKAYVAERNRLKDLKNTCWYYPIIPDETGKIPIFKTFKAGEITL